MKRLMSLFIIFNAYNSISAMRQPLAVCFYRHNYKDGEASVELKYKVIGSRDKSASFRIHSQAMHKDGTKSDHTIEWKDEAAKETGNYTLPGIISQIAVIQRKLDITTDEQDKKDLTLVLKAILLPHMRSFEKERR